MASENEREKRYDHLLCPIRDLAQNWNIDVAKDLEDYLDELEHIQISFDGGKTSLNFAEAALLIQGSACIYSRKVEYLYSLIYQALDMVHAQTMKSKKPLDAADADALALEEEAEEEFLLLDDVITEGKNIDIAEKPETMASLMEMTMNYSGGSNATPNQRRVAAALLAKTPLSAMAAARFDRRDGKDFRIMACAMGRNGALMLDASSFGTKDLLNVTIAPSASQNMTVSAANASLSDTRRSAVLPSQSVTDEVHMSSPGNDDDNMYYGADFDVDAQYYQADQSVVSAPVLRQRSARAQMAPAAKPDQWAQLDPNADVGPASHKPFKKGRTYMVLKNARLVADVGPMEAAAQAMAEAAANNGRGTREAKVLLAKAQAIQYKARLMKSFIPGNSSTQKRIPASTLAAAAIAASSRQKDSKSVHKLIAPILPEELVTLDNAVAAITNPSPLFPELDIAYSKLRADAARQRQAARRARAMTDPRAAAVGMAYEDAADEDDDGFEPIYHGQEAATSGDAGAQHADFGGDFDVAGDPAQGVMREPENWLDDVNVVKHGKDESYPSRFSLANVFSSLSGSDDLDNDNDYAALVEQHMKRIDAYIHESGMFAQESSLSRRVTEWQDRLMPVLEEEDQREEFDINVYGRRILQDLDNLRLGDEPKPEEPVIVNLTTAVKNPDPYNVCRSFLATLQLANFGNVEIVQNVAVSDDADSWAFSQPVFFDDMSSQSTLPTQTKMDKKQRGHKLQADFNNSNVECDGVSSFFVKLLSTELAIDNVGGITTADYVQSDDIGVNHEESAKVAGVLSSLEAPQATVQPSKKKRAPAATKSTRAKRTAIEGARNSTLDGELDDDSQEEATTARSHPVSPPKANVKRAHHPAIETATRGADEALPPSPYKPGELGSPLHKRSRSEAGAAAPLSSLPVNVAVVHSVKAFKVTSGGDDENIVAGGKRSRAAVAKSTKAK